jgi:hypothetical protein
MAKKKNPGAAGTAHGAKGNVATQQRTLTENPIGRKGRLRAELAQLRARYDNGAVAPGIYAVIRKLETEIAWSAARAEEEVS